MFSVSLTKVFGGHKLPKYAISTRYLAKAIFKTMKDFSRFSYIVSTPISVLLWISHENICCIFLIHSVSISFLLFSEADLYSFHFPLLTQSWMVFVSLVVLNRLCFIQCCCMLARALHLCFHLFLSSLLMIFFLCLKIPTCILSFIFTGKLLKNSSLLFPTLYSALKYSFHHLFFARCPKPFAQACLSLLTQAAQTSHSALLFVIQSMCHVSLYTSFCCFYTDCFSSCFSLCLLSFHVFGHPAVEFFDW